MIVDRIALFLNAQRLPVISLLGVIVLGALALRMPLMVTGTVAPPTTTDAAFTATWRSA